MRYILEMKHVFEKNGIYYFERRIPKDLLSEGGPRKIVKSLKTSDAAIAQARAKKYAYELDIRWAFERNPSTEMPEPTKRDAALSLLQEMGIDPSVGFTWQHENEEEALSSLAHADNPIAIEAFRIINRGVVYYPADALSIYIQMKCRDRGGKGVKRRGAPY